MIMAKYRKKPVTIEALQWNGFNLNEIKKFIGDNASIVTFPNILSKGLDGYNHTVPYTEITIHTLEGDMRVSLNDFVIKGVDGEFYPCKPDIFKKTYETVEE